MHYITKRKANGACLSYLEMLLENNVFYNLQKWRGFAVCFLFSPTCDQEYTYKTNIKAVFKHGYELQYWCYWLKTRYLANFSILWSCAMGWNANLSSKNRALFLSGIRCCGILFKLLIVIERQRSCNHNSTNIKQIQWCQ